MVLRRLVSRAVGAGVNAGINAVARRSKQQSRSQKDTGLSPPVQAAQGRISHSFQDQAGALVASATGLARFEAKRLQPRRRADSSADTHQAARQPPDGDTAAAPVKGAAKTHRYVTVL